MSRFLSVYASWVYLILKDPFGAAHAATEWFSESPTIRSIFHTRSQVLTQCAIKYLTAAKNDEILHLHKKFNSKTSLHTHVLNDLKYFDKEKKEHFGIGVPKKHTILHITIPEVLYIIVRTLSPESVVETGVASGISSTYILQALADNEKGKLFSIDISPTIWRNDKSTGWIIPRPLRSRWHLIIGPSSKKLHPLLEELRAIDLFLHDSSQTYNNMITEYQTAWPFLRKNGVLLSHDVQQNNAFSDFSHLAKRRRIYIDHSFAGMKK